MQQFEEVVAKLRPPKDVKEWTFTGCAYFFPTSTFTYHAHVIPISVNGNKLVRDPKTGAFNTTDLAALLQAATSASASAFKARGIPAVLRVVEVMGIEQGRRWGSCTMNEFRKFMGLKPFETFEEWNSDPDVHVSCVEFLYKPTLMFSALFRSLRKPRRRSTATLTTWSCTSACRRRRRSRP